MRGNIRKWCAWGALASAALIYPGCKSDSRDPSRDSVEAARQENPDTIIMEDSQAGVGGSGNMIASPAKGKKGGAHSTHSMAGDAGTAEPTDAGTGGSGFEPSALPNNSPGSPE
jgi:hypothetical protein